MTTPKYKRFYTLMCEQNEALFTKFDRIHNKYIQEDSSVNDTFHSVGRDVVDVVRFWERKLCSGMERGTNSVYSNKLADKFWDEVRTRYSHIDMVGVKTK